MNENGLKVKARHKPKENVSTLQQLSEKEIERYFEMLHYIWIFCFNKTFMLFYLFNHLFFIINKYLYC